MTETESSTNGVLVERDAAILTLTLNRPERKNALSIPTILALVDALDDAERDDVTRAVVLRGGSADFCTGIDLSASTRSDGRPRTGHLQRRMQDTAHRLTRRLHEFQLPVVASVRGWAAGLGTAIALSADVVIADPTARFWVPFVSKGFTPDSGTTFLLPRLVGMRRAKEMVLRSKPVDAATAVEWGLITEVVAADELDEAVRSVAAEFAGGPTVAIGLAKALLHRNAETTMSEALQAEAMFEELAVRSDDFKEGMRAFAEKRSPEYQGW